MRANPQRPTETRPAAVTPLLALCAAVLILLASVIPALAVEGPTRLFDPVVSPRSGTTTTVITFSVGYRNREGSAPSHVTVIIGGGRHAMTGAGGDAWKAGVTHTWSTTLPAGTHAVTFEAADTRRFSDTIDGGSVTITVPPAPSVTPKPTPAPTATPRPTAAPTLTPQPDPTASPTARPTTSAPPSTSAPTATPAATPSGQPSSTPAASAGPTDLPAATSTPGASGGGSSSGAPGSTSEPGSFAPPGSQPGSVGGAASAGGAPAPGGLPTAGGTAGDPGSAGPDNGDRGDAGRGDVVTGGAGWSAFSTALEVLGIDQPPVVRMIPMLVGTSGVVAMTFAFAIFGKKRRDEQPPAPDEVLHANAARGHGAVPGGEVAAGVRTAVVAAPLDLEAGMPRWRRPSLLEARKADPARYVPTVPRMSFDNGLVSADEGRERRVIRYRVVRLLDAPDELRSSDIGQLDQGDEVQLIERSGAYWLVLCPDGRQGWLHKMTLGDIVTDLAAGAGADHEIDHDVLAAYLSARARA